MTMRPGYYLVTPDGERRFVAGRVNPAALDRMCDRYLTEATGWRYWVDYCHGLAVDGRPAWSNLDHTDAFLDADARAYGAIL
jgi:hypothetical protein